jgi:hypothetical protein
MLMLGRARLQVALVPFERWRETLGGVAHDPADAAEASRLARQVEWAARRLPFATKCLPRAMALSWLLRREHISHAVVIATRPKDSQVADERLHAWVEVGGQRIIGDLPGPWFEILRLSDRETRGPAG